MLCRYEQRIHFPLTTAQQRRLLFETWQAAGYPALDHFPSRAPKRTRRTPEPIAAQVIALRQQHPDWGKQRLADELAKSNDWAPFVSPNASECAMVNLQSTICNL
jgi:hypothetical protein